MHRQPRVLVARYLVIKTRVYRPVIRSLRGSGYSEETTQDVYLQGVVSGVRIVL
uniref:U1740ah n=1 Tax=Mycobacterium leprae TaxID=1769 RepID=Q50092_MYCLR|nr:u1740ah [Mycobacterium leprae]